MYKFFGLDTLALNALPLLARLTFASTLTIFFWRSAMTKFDGSMQLSIGGFAQIFPTTFEGVGYDPSALSWPYHAIVLFGAISEIVLPILIIIGLMTRLTALMMIGFICVMSIVDIFGHHVITGAIFDGDPYGIIADQRLFWILNLITIFALGGGKFSLDYLLHRHIFQSPRSK